MSEGEVLFYDNRCEGEDRGIQGFDFERVYCFDWSRFSEHQAGWGESG